jgi:hypothetical protein
MGVDWSSDIVLGVKLKDLNPKEIVKENTVKRFDEISGKPYKKTAPENYVVFGSKEYQCTLKEFFNLFDEIAEDFNDNAEYEICLQSSSYIGDMTENQQKENIVVGIFIDGACENKPVKQINLNDINKMKLELLSFLKDKFDYIGDVDLYNILYVSY